MSQIVMITSEELDRLLESAVSRALSAHDGKPTLLDRQGLARALHCSPSHVDNLRQKGMPTLLLGELPRFELSAVLAWLRASARPDA